MTAALVLETVLLLLTSSAAAHTWSYDELVADCRPQLTVQVRFSGDPVLHSISFSLSTASFVNERLAVNSSDVDGDSSTVLRHLPCLYHGINTRTKESVFASVTDATRLRATFEHRGIWYSIEAPVDSETPASANPVIVDDKDLEKCRSETPDEISDEIPDFGSESRGESADPQNRRKRSLKLESFHGPVPLKMLELVLVGDVSFVSKAGNSSAATARMMEIANYVNGIYQALRLRVVLKEIILWSSDPIDSRAEALPVLRNFSAYKATSLTERHDGVMLLSSGSWGSGKLLGVAWSFSLCRRIFSSGIVADEHNDSISTAWIVAHEIGHLLGFRHVEDVSGCNCSSGGGCVMGGFSTGEHRLKGWSTCSYDAWQSQTDAIHRSCLKDAPQTSFFSSRTPLCGNGILEAGEQCDCGPSETCSSSCCNAATCQLKSGAACASGSCCNWDTCQLQPKGHRCRPAQDVCDVPETCNGTSEWCPEDDTKADGVPCDGNQAYCYKGRCNSIETQCKKTFSSSATPAADLCYTYLNGRGDKRGHCAAQLQRAAFINYSFYTEYNYTACANSNRRCGLLHCFEASKPRDATEYSDGNITCYMKPQLDLSSSGIRSPSLVPNGAACGSNSMCVDSTCRPLTDFTSCSDCPNCNGRGVLTAQKLCFCDIGFAPPNCTEAGCGGSITSTLCIKEDAAAASNATNKLNNSFTVV